MTQNYQNIIKILKDLNIEFEQIEHEVSKSCDDSKRFRDEKWLVWLWSKNIIFHAKWNFYLVVTHWDKQIKARNFKREFWSKDIRFSSQDEITPLLWATIWSIPPFGFDNSTIKIFVDKEIFESEYFIFNPSVPTKSIRIKSTDLRKIYENLENEIKYFIQEEDAFEIVDN
ncbi:MAG: hypothetical protein ACD_49C00067G0051 [uncultured bacterium (gcode 4)]|uniref:YbaK/aminoacyl-tRNA synthetase-associated domain-containing protein n=1 Tax=uncultured bacterium (gcode 4) TaxID=1234023 RepID=K2ADF3_9BACT|nr:MAG: hypothetical protein ACD_49C00067G0051 [uncultured bacterium (gcode 4)]